MQRTYDYVVVGNPTVDHDGRGATSFGGTCLYSSAQAAALGCSAAVYGRCGVQERAALERGFGARGVDLLLVDAAETTAFENVYAGSARTQHLRARGERIPLPPPEEAAAAVICHVGPVVDEVDLEGGRWDWLDAAGLVCCTPQGSMRRWDATGRISLAPLPPAATFWSRVDVLVVSEEEEPYALDPIARVLGRGGVVAVTRGPGGARLRAGAVELALPALDLDDEVDPSGAGDCFAAALAVSLHEGRDLPEAGRLAVVASGLSVTGRGLARVPSRAAVESYL